MSLAQLHHGHRGGVDRQVDAEALAAARRQQRRRAARGSSPRSRRSAGSGCRARRARLPVGVVGRIDDDQRRVSNAKWRSISGSVPRADRAEADHARWGRRTWRGRPVGHERFSPPLWFRSCLGSVVLMGAARIGHNRPASGWTAARQAPDRAKRNPSASRRRDAGGPCRPARARGSTVAGGARRGDRGRSRRRANAGHAVRGRGSGRARPGRACHRASVAPEAEARVIGRVADQHHGLVAEHHGAGPAPSRRAPCRGPAARGRPATASGPSSSAGRSPAATCQSRMVPTSAAAVERHERRALGRCSAPSRRRSDVLARPARAEGRVEQSLSDGPGVASAGNHRE